MRLELHPRQSQAFTSKATEILYGGAAGGGKSHLLRVAAIGFCHAIPGLQAYLFRRESPDLAQNHMAGPTGFPAMLAEYVQRRLVKINLSRREIQFWNGSAIHLAHCQYENDVYGYQGAEIHLLLMDELTHFTESIYTYLRGRCRLGALEIPSAYGGMFPKVIAGSNPGGVGHGWVKAAFIDGAQPMAIRPMPPEQGGMLRQYIPARLGDNPTLSHNDPLYGDKLAGLGAPDLVRAMKEGDWDIVAGGMLDDVWRRDIHVLEPFSIPPDWRVDRSFDWGSSKPFSVIWWAESDGSPAVLTHGQVRHFAPGTLFAVAEWYGSTGKPDEGLRLTAREIAAGIREREERLTGQGGMLQGHVIHPGPADNSIFDQDGSEGKSIGGVMREAGILWAASDKRPGSRIAGWEQLRQRLKAAGGDGEEGKDPQTLRPLSAGGTCPKGVETSVLAKDEPYTDREQRYGGSRVDLPEGAPVRELAVCPKGCTDTERKVQGERVDAALRPEGLVSACEERALQTSTAMMPRKPSQRPRSVSVGDCKKRYGNGEQSMEPQTLRPLELPGLFVFSPCVDWIRTVPVLPRDTTRPDDVDTRAEDHAGDATRYRILDRGLSRGRDLT